MNDSLSIMLNARQGRWSCVRAIDQIKALVPYTTGIHFQSKCHILSG